MKEGPALISVLLPTYNGAAYLRTALESIEVQRDEHVEVIAIDDGSTDDTVEILESFRSRLSLRVELPVRSGSWVVNTNRALAAARGEFVSLLHQDDGWLPGRLALLREMFRQEPEAVLALHSVRFVGSDGRRLGSWQCPLPDFPEQAPPDLVARRLVVQNFVPILAPLFRRQAAVDLGGLSPDLWYTADWDLWLKLSKRGSFLYFPRPLGFFRVHSESQTFRGRSDPREIRRQLEHVVARHLPHLDMGTEGRRCVERTACFSIEVNVLLFGGWKERGSLARTFWFWLRLGPGGWREYFRDSRILERGWARVRALTRAGRRLPGHGSRDPA